MKGPGLVLEGGARFTLAVHDEGVGFFHSASDGLHWAVSGDGLLWRAPGSGGEVTVGLQPLCAGHERPGEGPNLFCVDGSGALVAAWAGGGEIRVASPFVPVGSAAPWYAELPELGETTIMWDGAGGLYRAYFCGRRRRGRDGGRVGCIGTAVSEDLVGWRTEPPVFAPNCFPRMFAPHVFMHEGRVFLFYATPEEGELRTLRVAVAREAEGPFERTGNDVMARDCRVCAQTVPSGGGRLVFFGRALPGESRPQNVSRPGRLDFHADGRPFVRFCDALLGLAEREVMGTEARLRSGETLVRVFPRNARDFRLSVRVRSLGAAAAGVLFRTSATGSENVTLWLDFESGELLLRRGVKGRLLACVKRGLALDTDYCVTVWAEGAWADVFVDDEWALSAHTETRLAGGFGAAVRGGEVCFDAFSAQAIEVQ